MEHITGDMLNRHRLYYKIEYVCQNCSKHFLVDIKKGERAPGRIKDAPCPYCGVKGLKRLKK